MKTRVLVVEDNPASQELLCEWLDRQGYAVRSAENLDAAHTAFREWSPQIVLLDIQLGSEDGLELAQWMRRDPLHQDVPVIAVTAHAIVGEQERMMRSGCDACVSKPVDLGLLGKLLDDWKNIRRSPAAPQPANQNLDPHARQGDP